MRRSMPLGIAPRKSKWLGLCACLGFLLIGCSDADAGGPEPESPIEELPVDEPSVEIGLPGGEDGLDFVPFEAGSKLFIETFGQGGTHVLMAIRCHSLSKYAFVNVTFTNLETGVQVATPMTSRPQLLRCIDERTCDLPPLLVMVGGIAEPGVDRDGLRVRVEAAAHNQAGDRARSETEGVLSTERL
jgi:hypothetical protein